MSLLALFVIATQSPAWSNTQAPSTSERSFLDVAGQYLGVTYFTFFDGPGIGEDLLFSPNSLGRKHDAGWTLWTNLSARLKVSQRFAIDYQFRLQQVLTNDFELRSQGGRLGISGTLLKGKDWSLTGALNTDIPGVGQINRARKLVINPGLFSSFNYTPSGSRWSVFALVSPRFWIYSDPDAMDPQALLGGALPGQKPEYALVLQPSINYGVTEKSGLRLGLVVDVRKNANDPGMRRWFWPVDVGYTYNFNQRLSIYPHLRVSTPIDDGLRAELKQSVPWTHTASIGLWLNGTLL